MIWFREYTLGEVSTLRCGNMLSHIGIEFTKIGEDFLEGKMPVDHRTCQPAGLLHGGASVVLAETLGSVAAHLCVDPDKKYCVGQEVSASHLRAVRSGWVWGRAHSLHLGGRSQVWEIRIEDQKKRLVCVSRLTVAVLDWKK